MVTDNIPWTEKYRPTDLKYFISHDLTKNIILKLINNDNFHHLILYGPPGIGKTTLINIYLKYIFGENYNLYVLQLNGSDDRGINIVREEISNYANSNSIYDNKFKLVVLDEVDSMTHDAQNALKEIIELNELNTKFCLICNFINKLIYPLQSCCIIFRLSSILENDMKKFLLNIVNKEKIKYTNDGISTLIKLSDRDLRKACNNLQSISLSYNSVNKSNVYDCLGVPSNVDIANIFNIIKKNNLKSSIKSIKLLKNNKGYSVNILIKYVTEYILDLNLNNTVLIDILIELGNIQYNLSNLGTERIQVYSHIGLLVTSKIISDTYFINIVIIFNRCYYMEKIQKYIDNIYENDLLNNLIEEIEKCK